MVIPPTIPAPVRAKRPRGFWRRNAGGLLLLGVSLLIVIVVMAAPWISPYAPNDIVGPARTPPNGEFWFGTDQLGRDVFTRTLYGGQSTLAVAAISTIAATVVGTLIGVTAGYFSGLSSTFLMRFIDIMLAFPTMLLALVIIAIAGSNLQTLTLAVAIAYVPTFARVMFGSTRRIRNAEYILAARVIGASNLRILWNHVLRSLVVEIVVLASSSMGWAVLLAAGLSFLGFGVVPPDPEWGSSLSEGVLHINNAFWISAIPGIAITIVILITNVAGDRIASWWRRPVE